MVSSKFLLTGIHSELKSDAEIRVSVKSVALLVIANCVSICPEVLFENISFNRESEVNLPTLEFDVSEKTDTSESSAELTSPTDDVANKFKEEEFLEMKDDHFGPSTSTRYFDYMSPLLKNVDTSTTKPMKSDSTTLTKSDILPRRSFCCTQQITEPVSYLQSNQIMQDVLLFYNNSDPILRGNVILIVSNLYKSILENYRSFNDFYSKYHTPTPKNYLQPHIFINIIMKVSFYYFSFC